MYTYDTSLHICTLQNYVNYCEIHVALYAPQGKDMEHYVPWIIKRETE